MENSIFWNISCGFNVPCQLYLGSPRGSTGRLLGDIYTHRVQMFCLYLTITEVREGLQFHCGSWASNDAEARAVL